MTRTTGYLTTRQAAERLEALAYLERASAHILAGWIVKTPELDVKIEWGQQLAANMDNAARLLERGRALRAGIERQPCVPASWMDAGRAADDSTNTQQVLKGILRLKRGLAEQYANYLDLADPVADAGSIQLVWGAQRAGVAQIKWLEKRLGAGAISGRLSSRNRSPQIAFDRAIWQPLDRAPNVTRPKGMVRGQAGALRALPIHPRKDTGLFLHNFLNEEFATLELVARNSYEHPEMPLAFHRDAARHAADEARHAHLFLRALKDYGVRYGDYPVYTYSYEGEYEFEPCEPGSPRELLWRILLRQVIHEGMALDSTPFEVQKRNYLRQAELARIFEYTLADEVFHAGSGAKWGRFLVNGDEGAFQRERDAAYAYYAERLKDRRLSWGATHIAEAAYEAAQLEQLSRNYRFPFKIEVNVAARKKAGYTDREITQAKEEKTHSGAGSGERESFKENY